MAANPVAALVDARPISTGGLPGPTTTACSCLAMPPTIPTSALRKTSGSLSTPEFFRSDLNLLNAVVTLGSFAVILWNLSAAAPLHVFGLKYDIPGYLLWAALIYAVVGTIFTHLIGRALIALNFQQQRYEADFRFNLVRVRRTPSRSHC